MKGKDMLSGKTIITTDTSLTEIKKNVRNKAIDEFAEKLKELFKYESAWGETEYHKRFVIDISKIDEIAEQMKKSS